MQHTLLRNECRSDFVGWSTANPNLTVDVEVEGKSKNH